MEHKKKNSTNFKINILNKNLIEASDLISELENTKISMDKYNIKK